MTNARAPSVIPTPMPIREGFDGDDGDASPDEAAEALVEEPGFVTGELSVDVPNPAADSCHLSGGVCCATGPNCAS